MFRLRYTLTDSAKDTARYLVKCWGDEIIGGRFDLIDETTREERYYVCATRGVLKPDEFEFDPALLLSNLYELKIQGLIDIFEDTRSGRLKWAIQLRQELRNAVSNNFRKGVDPVVRANIAIGIGFASLVVSAIALLVK